MKKKKFLSLLFLPLLLSNSAAPIFYKENNLRYGDFEFINKEEIFIDQKNYFQYEIYNYGDYTISEESIGLTLLYQNKEINFGYYSIDLIPAKYNGYIVLNEDLDINLISSYQIEAFKYFEGNLSKYHFNYYIDNHDASTYSILKINLKLENNPYFYYLSFSFSLNNEFYHYVLTKDDLIKDSYNYYKNIHLEERILITDLKDINCNIFEARNNRDSSAQFNNQLLVISIISFLILNLVIIGLLITLIILIIKKRNKIFKKKD